MADDDLIELAIEPIESIAFDDAPVARRFGGDAADLAADLPEPSTAPNGGIPAYSLQAPDPGSITTRDVKSAGVGALLTVVVLWLGKLLGGGDDGRRNY